MNPSAISPKRAWIRSPGDTISLNIDGRRFVCVVPDTYTCLTIAVKYQWWNLLPGHLVNGDKERMAQALNDRDDRIDYNVLHYAVQSLSQLIYGWPMFAAARIAGTLRIGEPMFRMWCASVGNRPDDSWTAADWCAAGVAWFMSGAQKKEDATLVMSRLQSPTTLDPWGPGVTPRWVTESERLQRRSSYR